ncbi:MAG: glycosyltransferase family 39 protein [Fimbriimonadaceae bacterium]|nr:glycosyltransferase family 39 protein [Fimbriimonadaceae bacterium]
MSTAPKHSPERLVTLLAFGFFFVSLLIRLLGIGWGLPKEGQHYSLHPDEDVILSASRQIEPAKGKFDPGFYNYGTLYLTVERIASDVVAGYGGGPKEGDRESRFRYNGSCILAGRIINAVAGAFSVLLLLLIGLRFMSLWGACFAAGALAVAPGYVVHARFQTVDVFATFLLVCSIYFALKLLPEHAHDDVTEDSDPPDKDAETTLTPSHLSLKGGEALSDKAILKATVWAGVFAGLSAGTKYTGILAVLVLIAVHIALKRSDRWKMIGIGVAASLVAFFVATPGALLNTGKFVQDFKFEMLHTSTGHGLIFEGLPSGFLWHFVNLGTGFGGIVMILGIAGCFLAVRQKAKWLIAVLAFAILYYFLIGRAEVLFLRYTFPLMIPLALGFGYLVSAARSQQTKLGHFSVALGILALGGSAISASRMTAWMLGTDPRDQAAVYLREEAQKSPNDVTVGLVSDPWYYTPTLFPDSAMMRFGPEVYANAMAATASPRVVRYWPENREERIDWDTRLITETKPDYVVFSSFEADDLKRLEKVSGLKPEVQAKVDQFKAFTKQLFETYEPAITLGRTQDELVNLKPYAIHDLEYIRPYIWIWKRKTVPSTTPSNGS